MGETRVYLDHHAASPIGSSVIEKMRDARENAIGNPASAHAEGRVARRFLEEARRSVAAAIGAEPADVIFTSGGTEACNLAVLGLATAGCTVVKSNMVKSNIATSNIEHPAITAPVEALVRSGARHRTIEVRPDRDPTFDELDAVVRGADLLAVSWVNHVVGAVFPIEALAERCAVHGKRLVVDATQALGKLPVDVTKLGATAVAFASSKIGGPLGAGALWIDREAGLDPQMLGGGQERGRRGGTPDTVALCGFGAAASEIEARLATTNAMAELRDRLERHLLNLKGIANATHHRVASVSNVSFARWRGPSLVAALDLEGLAVSHGAACSSGIEAPSRVVRALWPDEPWRSESSVRLSLGSRTTLREIEECERIFDRVLARKDLE